jgi:hypothetical protein
MPTTGNNMVGPHHEKTDQADERFAPDAKPTRLRALGG